MHTTHESDERGAVLALLALFLGIFLFVAALAVDLSALATRGQDLQNTADSAALAAVVEYEEVRLATADEALARAAAEQAARDLLRQNGIDLTDPDINLVIEFPAGGGKVTVRIDDRDPNSFIGAAIPSYDPDVARGATAEFIACPITCSVTVNIPKPFIAASAVGDGDGYKPISVGNRMYAINHNSANRNIVCVDRLTQGPCWATAAQFAYGAEAPEKNPEMPHAAVVGDRIYWAASNAGGTWLYCWDTTFDFSCSPVRLSADGRADWTALPPGTLHSKDEDRGGGSIAVDGKVYTFTDNHEIHCFNPATASYCAGYNGRPYGGMPTALDAFPDNDPTIGNSGSSIDRIADEATGKIYSVIHIPNAVDCGTELTSGEIANNKVIIKNVSDDRFLSSVGAGVSMNDDALTDNEWWNVTVAGPELFNFENSSTGGRYLDTSPMGSTDDVPGPDDRWAVPIDNKPPPAGGAYALVNFDYDEALDNDVAGVQGGFYIAPAVPGQPSSNPDSMRWNFFPWECGAFPSLQSQTAPSEYQSGTWLHCYDTRARIPCSGFDVKDVPGVSGVGPIHLDGSRFSGRLWFYNGARTAPGDVAAKLGVCSSGFGAVFEPASIEVNCVDLQTGAYSASMSGEMSRVETLIQGATRTSPGAWGDPHWNQFENRLFYPTEHHWPTKDNPQPIIICHDFDENGIGADCGTLNGQVVPPPSPGDPTPSVVVTEDYGFFSDGNCVYALGHTSYFWAFKASDIEETCDAQPAPTVIEPCDCSDSTTPRYGTLDFREIDLSTFSVFNVRIISAPPDDIGLPVDFASSVPIFPSSGLFIEMLDLPAEDRVINLGAIADVAARPRVAVEIYVEGVGGGPVGATDLGSFDLIFPQRPHLIN